MESSVAEKKLKVAEFLEIEVAPNLIYELINGQIVKKSAPNPKRQKVSGRGGAIGFVSGEIGSVVTQLASTCTRAGREDRSKNSCPSQCGYVKDKAKAALNVTNSNVDTKYLQIWFENDCGALY